MSLLIMDWLHIVMWQLLIITINGERFLQDNITINGLENGTRSKRMPYPQEITLKMKINENSHVIKLTPTNQVLANRHLPVFMLTDFEEEKIRSLDDIMKNDVGEFTMYHDYCTRSAVVYFHDRRELDGVIKAKYKIEGLPIDTIDQEHETTSKYFRFLNVAKYFRRSCRAHNKLTEEGTPNSTLKVYPELLVAISHDMFEEIEKNSKLPQGVKTISHIITVYNAADMLFRFVRSAEISLNIAGVVIEGADSAWGFGNQMFGRPYIDADKINNQISQFFRTKDRPFSRHSYDYIAYNTRRKLLLSKQMPILGIATPAGYRPMFFSHIYLYRYNFAVEDLDSYEHYTTIAHELAHIFGAKHDKTFNWFFRPSCDRSVMAKIDCSSNICLKWSDRTERELAMFFGSGAHCILRNEPRSLYPPFPRKMLTRQEQCQCYGFESFSEPIDVPASGCYGSIICADKEGLLNNHLPHPMDGTPCGKDLDRVCWDDECRHVKHKKT